MQKITPCLWFKGNGEEAVKFYTSVVKNSRIKNVSRYGEGGPFPAGTAMMTEFTLAGLDFQALNGHMDFPFSEAISLSLSCESQAEVDEYWDKLSAGGQPGPCGWLKDRYGLSWQIVPTELGRLMSSADPAQGQRVMSALMQMGKLDIAKLKAAYEGK